MAALLSVRDLAVEFRSARGPVQAVRGVSFDVADGEAVAIIGESGSGKTTLAIALIKLIPRSARVNRGEILYRNERGTQDVLDMESDDLRRFRWNEAAMVFQSALNSFNPVINIWAQFLDTARAHGMSDPTAVRQKADELLDRVHLEPERVLRAYPHELSGGMKQRVLIALSLLLGPRLLILDEPTTALDILTQRAIIDLLRDLRSKLGFAMVFISHDLSLAAELADRVLTMYAMQLASNSPSALVDWNNNYGADDDKCVLFHCGNWAKSFLPDIKILNAPSELVLAIIGAVLILLGRKKRRLIGYARN